VRRYFDPGSRRALDNDGAGPAPANAANTSADTHASTHGRGPRPLGSGWWIPSSAEPVRRPGGTPSALCSTGRTALLGAARARRNVLARPVTFHVSCRRSFGYLYIAATWANPPATTEAAP
jgi:hypothetical protein